ncbi:hypothetical protein NL676_015827 [Syzygium grande]|nr:hypothetical protein NL676_015827 [Syzygium grande]
MSGRARVGQARELPSWVGPLQHLPNPVHSDPLGNELKPRSVLELRVVAELESPRSGGSSSGFNSPRPASP